jgi:RNA polymerase sigma-70 factor (ECF subfamily)
MREISAPDSFPHLMRRLRAGDQEAAYRVFDRFSHRLVGLAHKRLGLRLRSKLDPEDVLQSVFRSFFRRNATGEFAPDSWDSLWSLLTAITLHKCGHQIDYFRAGCRDVAREAGAAANSSPACWEALAREPTPAEAVLLTETIEQLIASFADTRERRMVELALQGEDAAEIAPLVHCSQRTVQRILSRVRKRLQRLCDSEVD